MEEVSSGFESVGLNEGHNEIEIEKAKSVEDPKIGMLFDSIDDLVQFYQRYAKEKGFGMCIRSSKKVGGEVRYVTVACNHSGKPKIKSSKLHQLHPQSKTDCKAKICANLLGDGKWILRSMVLDHNHGVSPGKARFYRCHRVLNSAVKRRLELHAKAGIRMNKSFNSLVVQAGGHEKLTYLEKDCRNHMDRVRRIELGEGDATAMHNYFLKMQADNSEFFHMMDLDEEGRLRNVFWADARSRAAFKEFGDVVTFDTTYLVNKYAMPFAPFVGVNHHGQSTLLGCGLISGEDTETFIWLFQSWLTCMSGYPPSAIITDQDQAMKNAIEVVFPNARHRWCLWHIMKKLPEKLRGYNQYEGIKFSMKNVVYDSLTIGEFEESWGKFIEKYKLQSNKWLFSLYDERHRWVPTFVKDTFWAGMSTTQRSESMHAFFDGYVNSKTTLKQFVEQYKNALAKKVENENSEEFNSFNSCIPCMVGYEMEKQFQSAYTTAKFKEFQRELMGKISRDLSLYKKDAYISEYEVAEDILFGESRRRVSFNVCFDEDTNEVYCNCRLFEYRGILCRHQIVVFIHRKVDQIPDKYILKRWPKNVKRSHTKVRISYDNWALKPEARRFDKMCNVFYEVADLAAVSEDWSEKFIERICDFRVCMKQDSCRTDKQISVRTRNGSMSCGDGIGISKESTNILDPLVAHSKGRPPFKRKQSMVEKVTKKKKEGKKKIHSQTCTENVHKHTVRNSEKELQDNGNMHGTRVVELVTEENIHLHNSEMQQSPHIGQESYDYNRGLGMWPNMTSHPSIIGMSPYFGQPNLLQGGSSSFQASMFRQGVGMYPFEGHHHSSPSWRADLEMGGVMHPNNFTGMLEMGGVMHPSNFTGMLTVNDMAQAKSPTLHKDDKKKEH